MTGPADARRTVVIVCFSYYPRPNPRAYRWTALAGELVRRGRRVMVVTSWRPGLARSERRDGVDIERVGNRWMEQARALAGGTKGAGAPGGQARRAAAGGIAGVGARLWRSIAWPDSTCTWYPAALAAVQAIRARHPDAVLVTVTPSFTAALVGLRIARADAGLRWILDMGDPFSLAVESAPNSFALYSRLNARTERAVFERADGVALTNEVMRARYGALYPCAAPRLACIHPLLDPAMAVSPVAYGRALEPRPVRIVFAGTLYRTLRRPDFLLALFARLRACEGLPRMELHFYGDASECADAFPSQRASGDHGVFVHGPVGRPEALEATRSADILVDIGNLNGCQLPSKLVEYLASGRPIIELCASSDSAACQILQAQPGVLIVEAGAAPDERQVSDVAAFVIAALRAGPLPHARRLDPFLLPAIADAYEALIDAAPGHPVRSLPGGGA